jgi:hypothetical protein
MNGALLLPEPVPELAAAFSAAPEFAATDADEAPDGPAGVVAELAEFDAGVWDAFLELAVGVGLDLGAGAPTAFAATTERGWGAARPAGFDDGRAASIEIAVPVLQLTVAPWTSVQVVPSIRMSAAG